MIKTDFSIRLTPDDGRPMVNRIQSRLALLALIVASLASIVAWPMQPEKSSNITDRDRCEVYRIASASIPRNQSSYLQTQSALPAPERLPVESHTDFVPAEFDKNGERRIFNFKTQDLVSGILTAEQMELTQCFGPAVRSPNFYSGSLEQLESDAEMKKVAVLRRPTLISFSPIGFSADAKHALLYIEDNCSGRCGQGSLILLRKKDGHWKEFGSAPMWIS